MAAERKQLEGEASARMGSTQPAALAGGAPAPGEGAPVAGLAPTGAPAVERTLRRPVREGRRAAQRSLFARALRFLRACWAELHRMQWPDREHTAQATAVVLGFVVVAGIYLAIADLISQKVVNLIF